MRKNPNTQLAGSGLPRTENRDYSASPDGVSENRVSTLVPCGITGCPSEYVCENPSPNGVQYVCSHHTDKELRRVGILKTERTDGSVRFDEPEYRFSRKSPIESPEWGKVWKGDDQSKCDERDNVPVTILGVHRPNKYQPHRAAYKPVDPAEVLHLRRSAWDRNVFKVVHYPTCTRLVCVACDYIQRLTRSTVSECPMSLVSFASEPCLLDRLSSVDGESPVFFVNGEPQHGNVYYQTSKRNESRWLIRKRTRERTGKRGGWGKWRSRRSKLAPSPSTKQIPEPMQSFVAICPPIPKERINCECGLEVERFLQYEQDRLFVCPDCDTSVEKIDYRGQRYYRYKTADDVEHRDSPLFAARRGDTGEEVEEIPEETAAQERRRDEIITRLLTYVEFSKKQNWIDADAPNKMILRFLQTDKNCQQDLADLLAIDEGKKLENKMQTKRQRDRMNKIMRSSVFDALHPDLDWAELLNREGDKLDDGGTFLVVKQDRYHFYRLGDYDMRTSGNGFSFLGLLEPFQQQLKRAMQNARREASRNGRDKHEAESRGFAEFAAAWTISVRKAPKAPKSA